MNNKILTGIILTACLGATGCQQYIERKEGVTSFAGNSLAANEANMVVDPWPPNVDNTDIPANGKRMTDVHGNYQDAKSPVDETQPTTLGALLGTPVSQ